MDWIAAAFTMVGLLLVVYKSKWNFVAFIVGNIFWILVALLNTTKLWGMASIQVVLIVFGVWGFIRWGKVSDDA